MNIGSVDLHNDASAPFHQSDGELFVDRAQGLKKGKQDDNESLTSSSLLKSSSKLSHAIKKDAATPDITKKEDESIDKDVTKVSGTKAAIAKKRRARKKWKKPASKPNRPLSAYNLFFAEERKAMLGDDAPTAEQEALKKRVHCKTHGKIGFAEMAKTVGQKWRSLDPETKKTFEDRARKEKERYQIELAIWKEEEKRKSRGGKSSTRSDVDSMPSRANMSASAMSPGQMNMQALCAAKNSFNAIGGPNVNGMYPRSMSQFRNAPQADYIRAMQERPIHQAALFGMASGRSDMQPHQQQYPNAAEASANTLLNHFQQGFQNPLAQNHVQAQWHSQSMLDRELFQELAAMRRLQQRFQMNSMNFMGGMNQMNGMGSINGVGSTDRISGMNGMNNSNKSVGRT